MIRWQPCVQVICPAGWSRFYESEPVAKKLTADPHLDCRASWDMHHVFWRVRPVEIDEDAVPRDEVSVVETTPGVLFVYWPSSGGGVRSLAGPAREVERLLRDALVGVVEYRKREGMA